MKKIDQRYYEPLEQMMAIRHNYMAKVIQNEFGISIYDFFRKKGPRSGLWNWEISSWIL